jgi:hypothetical protein
MTETFWQAYSFEGTADHQTDSAIIFSCVGATDFRDVSSLSRSISKAALPKDLPPVVPADVSILYVEPGPNGAVVREMPLNERGELVKAWPGGFFEEGLREHS